MAFFLIRAPTQLSALSKKRDQNLPWSGQQRSKGCHSLWYRTIFISSADVLSQQIPVSLQNRGLPQSAQTRSTDGSLHSAPPPSQRHPRALLPPTGTAAQRVPTTGGDTCQGCERAARRKQQSCPQFFTFFLAQAQQLKLCLYCSIPAALNTSGENRSLYFPLLTLTEPSKQRKKNF